MSETTAAYQIEVPAQGSEEVLSAINETIQDLLDAQQNLAGAAARLQEALLRNIEELRKLKPERLVRRRREKFLRMGQWDE